jgi:hypothetical protein
MPPKHAPGALNENGIPYADIAAYNRTNVDPIDPNRNAGQVTSIHPGFVMGSQPVTKPESRQSDHAVGRIPLTSGQHPLACVSKGDTNSLTAFSGRFERALKLSRIRVRF